MKQAIGLLILLLLFFACEQKSNVALTDEQELNMQLAEQDNVASFGAPPMIPVDHPVEIGEDVSLYQNGGEDCLECHADDGDEDAPQTLHPERNNCLQCHIPQSDESATEKDFKVENAYIKHIPGQ